MSIAAGVAIAIACMGGGLEAVEAALADTRARLVCRHRPLLELELPELRRRAGHLEVTRSPLRIDWLARLSRRWRRASVLDLELGLVVARCYGPRRSRRDVAAVYVTPTGERSAELNITMYVSPCGRGRRRAARRLAQRTGGHVLLLARRGRVVDYFTPGTT